VMSSRWVIGLEVKGETTVAENFTPARKIYDQVIGGFSFPSLTGDSTLEPQRATYHEPRPEAWVYERTNIVCITPKKHELDPFTQPRRWP
jgi:hypothetical protein